MNYAPRMNNQVTGFSVLNCFHRRYWDGMVADLWDVRCAPEAGGFYVGNDPRLFILLNAKGEDDSAFHMAEIGGAMHHYCRTKAVSFIPAGMEMEAQLSGLHCLRHLDLHFDQQALARRLGGDFDDSALQSPRLMLAEPRLIALAELIAAECASPEPLHDLYGDGLSLALLLAAVRIPPSESLRRSKLAQWQVRRVVEFIDDNCLRNIRLEELAQIVGLSESYFSHAFKATTGLPPHQWQMRARIDRVKDMLLKSELSLTEIAAETGFADPAHFSRMFRRQVGVSPSMWRRTQRA